MCRIDTSNPKELRIVATNSSMFLWLILTITPSAGIRRMMSDEEQMREKKIEVRSHRNSPKTSQDTLLQCRLEYEAGNWKSVRELAEKYGIQTKTLHARIEREGWSIKRMELLGKIEKKIEQKTLSLASEYLSSSFLRAKKYEALIDKSISQNEDMLPPGDLDAYTRSELRIHELAKSALRIPAVSAVDVTSKGLSVGESIITAIEKLRANPSAIVHVSSEQVDRVLEMEVVDDPPKA